MSLDAPTAAPSAAVADATTPVPATDAAVINNDVSAYREARRAERAGKPLDPKTIDSASSPDAPAKPASDATSAAPSAASPGKPEKRTDPRATENRVPELLAERAQLRAENDAIRRRLEALERPATRTDATPAASSPASAQAGLDPNDPEPKLEDFEADPTKYPDPYTAHQRALARWEARNEFRTLKAEEQTRVAKEHREQVKTERFTTFRKTIDGAGGQPFLESLSEEVRSLRPFDSLDLDTEEPNGLNAVAQQFLVSPVAPALMRHFSDHPEELRRFAGLHPTTFFLEMGKLEERLGKPKAAATAPKTTTSAPAPPTVLGGRPTEPADELEGAVAADDVAAYKAAKQRQRAASLVR